MSCSTMSLPQIQLGKYSVSRLIAGGNPPQGGHAILLNRSEKIFEFVFGHIKSTDAVIVGMYPRYTDQVKENADFTRTYG